MPRIAWLPRVASYFLATVWLALIGCGREEPRVVGRSAATGQLRPSVTLRVLVVNEAQLSEGIVRLQGEWMERFGGELTAFAVGWTDLASAKTVEADVIVFPSRYLGELCVRGWLRPMRPHVLESEQLDMADILPFVRRELIRWGGQSMALPLGINLPLMAETRDQQPVLSFLLSVAPSLITDDRVGKFFDLQTMRPRITEPPFVEALSRLVERAGDSSEPTRCAIPPVPILGFGDRLIAVSTASHNAASAFKLITWLAQADISTQLARSASPMLPVRRSLAASALWYDPALTAGQRGELGKMLEAALSGERCLLVPRIPGVDEYLAALDQGVKSALFENVPAAQALEWSAQRWEQITDAHGRESQRAAYLKHLGIDEP